MEDPMNTPHTTQTRLNTLGVLVLFLLSLAAGALAAPPTPAQAAALPTLRVSAGTSPATLDPQLASNANEISHLRLMYEGLTRIDQHLNTVPAAAKSWAYNETATQLTFTLRADLYYPNEKVVNALRFKNAVLRALDPTLQTPFASLFDAIAGAYEYRTADPLVDDLAALQAAVQIEAYYYPLTDPPVVCGGYGKTNCLALVINFTRPSAWFHTLMSTWPTYPTVSDSYEQGEDWWTHPELQLGNGPFMMSTFDPLTGTTFVPNPNYWRGLPTYQVHYRYFNSNADALSAYILNQLDILQVTADISALAAAHPELTPQSSTYGGSCTYAFLYHQGVRPFDNQKIREAFSHAVDRQALIDEVLAGWGQQAVPTLTWIAPGYAGYDAGETRWAYDQAAAQAALAASGYTVNDLGQLVDDEQQVVEILDSYVELPRNIELHEWLAAQVLEVLGIVIEQNPVDQDTFNGLRQDLATMPPIYRGGWCADHPEPQNWLSAYWHSGGNAEWLIGYNNPALEALLEIAEAEQDNSLRTSLFMAAQDYLIGGAPFTALYNNRLTFLVKPRVTGAVSTPMDMLWTGEIDPLLITVGLRTFLPVVLK